MTVDQPGGLGSLAQSARTKQLKTARGILYFVGILTLVVNVGLAVFAEPFVNSQIDREVESVRRQGMQIDQSKLEELRDQAIRSTQLGGVIGAVIGVVFIACAVMVYQFPVATTVTSLVLYLGAAAGYAVFDPTTLARGWIVKILIVVGLFKAVQAAIAYENERKASQPSGLGSLSPTMPADQPLS
jgi:hypothetical protein